MNPTPAFVRASLLLGALLSPFAAQATRLPIGEVKALSVNFEPQAGIAAEKEFEVRGAPGAGFVKLHFDYFKLPAGAVLEVMDASGKEVYRYSSDKLGPHTVDAKLGENGKTSFAAMSVNGEVARVRLLLNGAAWNWAEHGVRVRKITEGFSPERMAAAMHGQSMSADGRLLSICGADERKEAACFENSHAAEFERSRPVARLVMQGGLCTAWRVGNGNFMMTNNHCFSTQSEAQASEVWFNYQRSSCTGTAMAPVVKVAVADLLKTDYTLDYTLFTLRDPAAVASFGNLGLEVRDLVKDEQIFIPQHGAGNPKQLAITSDVNNGALCRIDNPLQGGRGANTDAGYRCDTVGGSSGSPVLSSSSRKVIALHHLGGCPSGNNSGALISKIWPQIASFFNNQIPAGNGGGTPTPNIAMLQLNQAKSNLSGAKGGEVFFALDLASAPANLRFTTSGGTGDLDMYVRYGSLPGMNQADCKAQSVGNAESCVIATPKAGRYYVMLRGNDAYAGASLLAAASATARSFENKTRFDIPDKNTAGINSPVSVPLSGAAGNLTVDVDIVHTYVGDLIVELIAPNGKVFSLQRHSGGSTDNLNKTFSVNAGTVNASGTWKLHVVDAARVDVGYLKSWKLNFSR
ncbi:proprotein convertase P-domain-containing protein [Massilia sp. W12]|uniref:proprotein convertase P-domain-containing protein n=1 Tax=Massilia sp. W12 TaxID=3126507 RepID=UPI0030D44190